METPSDLYCSQHHGATTNTVIPANFWLPALQTEQFVLFLLYIWALYLTQR